MRATSRIYATITRAPVVTGCIASRVITTRLCRSLANPGFECGASTWPPARTSTRAAPTASCRSSSRSRGATAAPAFRSPATTSTPDDIQPKRREPPSIHQAAHREARHHEVHERRDVLARRRAHEIVREILFYHKGRFHEVSAETVLRCGEPIEARELSDPVFLLGAGTRP